MFGIQVKSYPRQFVSGQVVPKRSQLVLSLVNPLPAGPVCRVFTQTGRSGRCDRDGKWKIVHTGNSVKLNSGQLTLQLQQQVSLWTALCTIHLYAQVNAKKA